MVRDIFNFSIADNFKCLVSIPDEGREDFSFEVILCSAVDMLIFPVVIFTPSFSCLESTVSITTGLWMLRFIDSLRADIEKLSSRLSVGSEGEAGNGRLDTGDLTTNEFPLFGSLDGDVFLDEDDDSPEVETRIGEDAALSPSDFRR